MRAASGETLFNSLIEHHPYPAYEQPTGEQLKYLVCARPAEGSESKPAGTVAMGNAFRGAVVLVCRLDRRGRSLADLVVALKELSELRVGFVSLTEDLDLTTRSVRERIRAGLFEVQKVFRTKLVGKMARETGIEPATFQLGKSNFHCKQRT